MLHYSLSSQLIKLSFCFQDADDDDVSLFDADEDSASRKSKVKCVFVTHFNDQHPLVEKEQIVFFTCTG